MGDGLKACSEKGSELGNPLEHYLSKASKHLAGSTQSMLKASENELVAVHNASKQALLKLQKLNDEKAQVISIDYKEASSSLIKS